MKRKRTLNDPFILDSKDRHDPSSFTVESISRCTLNFPFSRPISSITLKGGMIPSLYNVRTGFNTMQVTSSTDGLATATITPGNYDVTELLAAVKAELDADHPGAAPFTVSYDDVTLLVTITTTAGTVSVNGTGTTKKSLTQLLGFSPVATASASPLTAPRALNLSNEDEVYLSILEMGERGFTTGTDRFTFALPMELGSKDTLNFPILNSRFQQTLPFDPPIVLGQVRCELRWPGPSSELVDTLGRDWRIYLEIEDGTEAFRDETVRGRIPRRQRI